VTGSCEICNEPSGSIRSGEFLHRLNNYQLLKAGFSPVSYLDQIRYKDYYTPKVQSFY